MKANTDRKKRILKSLKIIRLDNKFIFPRSASTVKIIHELTGIEYDLKKTPNGGLQLTK